MLPRSLPLIPVIVSFLLAISLGVIAIVQNHHGLYHLLYSISAFVLAMDFILTQLWINYITTTIQLIISIFNIVSGILFVIHNPSKVTITILFIINVIFITASIVVLAFLLIMPNLGTSRDQHATETVITKKGSDATLFEEYPPMESIWFKDENTRKGLPYTYSNNTIPMSQSHQSNMTHGSYNASIMNLDEHVDELRRPRPISSITISDNSNNNNHSGSSNNGKLNESINSSKQMKKQRWKLINTEKQYLANINESLLPPLLQNNTVRIPEAETERENKREKESKESKESTEPQETKEDLDCMSGLEQVSGYQNSIGLISLDEYKKARLVMDYNISPGLHRIVSDGNLKVKQISIPSDYLLPVKETPPDNIDHLSELELKHEHEHEHEVGLERDRVDSAPSLYTYRNEFQQSPHIIAEQESAVSAFSAISPTTPLTPPVQQTMQQPMQQELELNAGPMTPPAEYTTPNMTPSKSESPLKRLFEGSPRRIFRSSTTTGFNTTNTNLAHKHSTSVISNFSLKSNRSSISKSKLKIKPKSKPSSPKKLKSILKLHKHSVSVPNIAHDPFPYLHSSSISTMNYPQFQSQFQSHSHTQSQSRSQSQSQSSSPQHTAFYSMRSQMVEPIDMWDTNTARNYHFSNDSGDLTTEMVTNLDPPNEAAESRVSSVPSQVIGEYDKEKWKILQGLEVV